MRKCNVLYGWISICLILGFFLLIGYLANQYCVMIETENAYLTWAGISKEDYYNFPLPTELLTSRWFILLSYYVIPYLLCMFSFYNNRGKQNRRNHFFHNELLYRWVVVIFLVLIGYGYYQMCLHVIKLQELFVYLNFFFLNIFVYATFYALAYYLGKQLAIITPYTKNIDVS